MPVISGVDLVIAVEGRTCADVNLDVTAIGWRVGGGAGVYGGINVNVSGDGGSAGGSAGDVNVTAVSVELMVASMPLQSEVVLVVAVMSPQSEVELVVLLVVVSVLMSPQLEVELVVVLVVASAPTT